MPSCVCEDGGLNRLGHSRSDLRQPHPPKSADYCRLFFWAASGLKVLSTEHGASHVVCQESITFAKAAATSTMIARLVAFDEAGSERLLGEYTFNHTRSLPALEG